MDDSIIFMTGVSVFGLMLVGIVMTILEFRKIAEHDARKRAERGGRPAGD
ncbi:MAG: hypothetical protein ACO3KY_05250 [Lysobacterales bacterium]